MKLLGCNILLISPEPWDHLFVSKHHYAIHLGKRANKIFFLNPPGSTFEVIATKYENVFSVAYQGFPIGLRFYPSTLQKFFIRRKFRQLEKLCGVQFDVVWSFDNSVFYDFSTLPNSVFSISHIVDFNQDFNTETAASTANICLATSDPILNRLLRFNPSSYKINHGYTMEMLQKRATTRIGHPIKCCYAGNLDIPFVDWELVIELLKGFPQLDFLFAGSWDDLKRMKTMESFHNFRYVGKLKADELPNFYSQASVLLVLYKSQEFSDQLSNPHKMMEYLGAGKVIMATWTEEYADLAEKQLIKMSRTKQDFLAQLTQIIEDLSHWNDDAKVLQRKAYAMENSYDKQIERIEALLNRT